MLELTCLLFFGRQEKLIYSNANATDHDGYRTRVYRISTRNICNPIATTQLLGQLPLIYASAAYVQKKY